MTEVINERRAEEAVTLGVPPLYVVWIDLSCGNGPVREYEENSDPQALWSATIEAASLPAYWGAKALPEGKKP